MLNSCFFSICCCDYIIDFVYKYICRYLSLLNMYPCFILWLIYTFYVVVVLFIGDCGLKSHVFDFRLVMFFLIK